MSHTIESLQTLSHLSLIAVYVLGDGCSHHRLVEHLMNVKSTTREHCAYITVEAFDEFCCI